MTKFLCTHTLPPHAVTPEQLRQIAQVAQSDPRVRGYRSFCNLSEGKIVCIMEAPDKAALAEWFQKMKMPFDAIVPVEFEGDRGNVREESPAYATSI
jgi:hypothetical protein